MSMQDRNKDSIPTSQGRGEAETTLQWLARRPAPEGLEERVKSRLADAAKANRLLRWPAQAQAGGRMWQSQPFRVAAAAAVVCAVMGSGWAMYSHVAPAAEQRMAMPRIAAPGGFSAAGAMRTPQSLNGPVLTHKQKEAGNAAAGKDDGCGKAPNCDQKKAKDNPAIVGEGTAQAKQ